MFFTIYETDASHLDPKQKFKFDDVHQVSNVILKDIPLISNSSLSLQLISYLNSFKTLRSFV